MLQSRGHSSSCLSIHAGLLGDTIAGLAPGICSHPGKGELSQMRATHLLREDGHDILRSYSPQRQGPHGTERRLCARVLSSVRVTWHWTQEGMVEPGGRRVDLQTRTSGLHCSPRVSTMRFGRVNPAPGRPGPHEDTLQAMPTNAVWKGPPEHSLGMKGTTVDGQDQAPHRKGLPRTSRTPAHLSQLPKDHRSQTSHTGLGS